ncbi:MAG: hypothetical protein ACQGVK_04685 [Myxococcota bacterium]
MTISVVIPALDEAENIAGAIGSVVAGVPSAAGAAGGARAHSPAPSEPSLQSGPERAPHPSSAGPHPTESRSTAEVAPAIEICVVDGGSRDATVARAREAGRSAVERSVIEPNVIELSVIELDPSELDPSEPGVPAQAGGSARRRRDPGASRRAHQLQVGLEATRGEIVIFLHADTRLPGGWVPAVRGALASPGAVGGAFRFAFRESGARGLQRISLRLVELGAQLRSSGLGLPYGDQALFASRSALVAVGGVPQVALMEDLDLVRALRRSGRMVMLGQSATTSPRRHLEGGVWRIALRHAAAAFAWGLGVDRARLARWLGR